jgi:hypothetical protein
MQLIKKGYTMGYNRLFAISQLIAGGFATLLVVIAFFSFNQPLRDALVQLDGMAAKAGSEMETVENLLQDINGVAESLQVAIPSHRDSLASIGRSTLAVAETISAWENEIPGFQKIAGDAAHICDTFAEQLPIVVPVVEMKEVKFQLPKIIPKTQKIDVPYPTARVEMDTVGLNYPTASVQTRDFSKSFGSVAGRSLGSVGFSYPSGISIGSRSMNVRYPNRITIGSANKSVSVPATPEINMKDYSFRVPNKLTNRELMKDEKALLEQSSMQLTSIRETMNTTKESLVTIRGLLAVEIQESFEETDENLTKTEAALTTFRTQRIPGVLEDLRSQREGLSETRKIFTAIGGLIPLLFGIFGLVTAAIALSGGAKLFALRRQAAEK